MGEPDQGSSERDSPRTRTAFTTCVAIIPLLRQVINRPVTVVEYAYSIFIWSTEGVLRRGDPSSHSIFRTWSYRAKGFSSYSMLEIHGEGLYNFKSTVRFISICKFKARTYHIPAPPLPSLQDPAQYPGSVKPAKRYAYQRHEAVFENCPVTPGISFLDNDGERFAKQRNDS
jgi:hypothetical protein